MRFRKVYGQSRVDSCPFCGKQAVTENPEGVPVCIDHKGESMPAMKCICGEWLDLRKGKFGAYFSCMRCGNVSFSKAMEANPNFGKTPEEPKKQENAKPQYRAEKETKKETVIRSDELDFYCG